MCASKLEWAEIAEGVHYHAWALMPSVHILSTGRRMTQLVYAASMQPHRDRTTARRHAKQMAEPENGKAGYMALKCGGGASCVFMFDPFNPFPEGPVDPVDAFAQSGAKALLTPHKSDQENEGVTDGE